MQGLQGKKGAQGSVGPPGPQVSVSVSSSCVLVPIIVVIIADIISDKS